MTIKNIIFDLGGVVITLDHQKAVEAFRRLGLADAEQQLDPYTQGGIFGDLEQGAITADKFRQQLSVMVGRVVSYDECRQAWLAYHSDLPRRNLQCLRQLRKEGYRLLLLSNTNHYMMSWAESPDFDGEGNALSTYFDATYKSFEVGLMKPDERIFRLVIEREGIVPEETLFVDDGPRNIETAIKLGLQTLCPVNGEDWTGSLYELLAAG